MAAAIAMIGNSIGCVSLEHYVHRHVFDAADHEQPYYHCPHCGQIIPKQGKQSCPKCRWAPAFYGYEATCWRQFPAGWGCPPETIFDKPGLIPPGLLEVPEVIELPRGGEELLDPLSAPPSPPAGAVNLHRSSSSDLLGVADIEATVVAPQLPLPTASSTKAVAKKPTDARQETLARGTVAAKQPLIAKAKAKAGAKTAAKPHAAVAAETRPTPLAPQPAPAIAAPEATDSDLFPLETLVQKSTRPRSKQDQPSPVEQKREAPKPRFAAAEPPRVEKQNEPTVDPLPPAATAESLPHPQSKFALTPQPQAKRPVSQARADLAPRATDAQQWLQAAQKRSDFNYVLQSSAPTLAPATVLMAADVGPSAAARLQSVSQPHAELPNAASGSAYQTQTKTVAHFDPTDFSEQVVVPVAEDTVLLPSAQGFRVQPAQPLMLNYIKAARSENR